MNRVFLIAVILIITICFVWSCREESSIVSVNHQSQFVKLSGKIFGILGVDTLWADSALIILDNQDTSYSESNGIFIIDSLVTGTHQLSVRHPYFFTKDTVLTISDSANIIIIEMLPILKLSGKIFGIVGVDTLWADSALIILDNQDTSYSQSNGIFIIDSLVTGTHQLSVRHPYFFPKDTVLTISNIANIIIIEMLPQVKDFFPLHVGLNWTFSYKYSYGYSPYYYYDDTIGIDHWKLDREERTNQKKKYYMVTQFDGINIRTYKYPSPGSDTSTVTFSGSFIIVEDSTHRITIESAQNLTTGNYLFINLINFLPRYNKPNYGGNIFRLDGSMTADLASDTGLVRYEYRSVGIHYTIIRQTLLSFY